MLALFFSVGVIPYPTLQVVQYLGSGYANAVHVFLFQIKPYCYEEPACFYVFICVRPARGGRGATINSGRTARAISRGSKTFRRPL